MSFFTGTKEEIEKKCKKELPEDIVLFIEKCMKKPHSESNLIAVLHKLQNKLGYLPKEKLQAVAYLMNIPAAKVSGVATFYHYFSTKPPGKYVISVCLGTACHVKGSDKILERIQEELGIKIGETTSDGLFTLEGARCIGTCALAPVVKIGDDIHPKVTPAQIPEILETYFKKSKESK